MLKKNDKKTAESSSVIDSGETVANIPNYLGGVGLGLILGKVLNMPDEENEEIVEIPSKTSRSKVTKINIARLEGLELVVEENESEEPSEDTNDDTPEGGLQEQRN